MATIQNQAIIQKLIDELELYPAKDVIPTELADKILPVFQVNSEQLTIKTPTANIVKSDEEISGGSTTLYTTPTTGKFFLTNVVLEATAKTSSTQVCKITITIDGSTEDIALIGNSPITSGDTPVSPSTALNLQNPVLVDAGTNIVLTSSGSSLRAYGVIVGYTEAD